MNVHILDDWFDTLRGLPCFAKLAAHDVTVWTDHEPDPIRLAARTQDAECLVLFRERTKITRDLLERLPNLRLISQRSVCPHIDVPACTDTGVLLSSNMHRDTPSYAAAEMTLALILASYRQIPEQVVSIRNGDWQAGVGRTLRRRTLGLYGYGRIARAVAGYAEAIGVQVQWWASEAGRARAKADGQHVAESRKAFFAGSDIVSLHVRLKPETRRLITGQDLAQMAPRSLLVNTSRAGLIETGALEVEIARGRIYAAVDVFEQEPLTETDHPLLTHPNVLPTPHLGYVTEDEFDLQFNDIFDQVNAYDTGKPIHMINPEVWRP
ncbi:D-2-hydroxyacid dehydrogenase family protein [Roseobacter sp. HKCCD9010]|uniref:D-2-hydroxyacid dehydrogenase family protein n=1 Tax=unclassified Roseobacter TaxID=196798 RepID=UPI00149310EC|nr:MULTISPECIES: D-2-hydroxyacid dehydrogenase family protein [unclassified Roseobacter]MBF9052131.1 D-2-hydroxyacid dehydrogenase family protein [Rhodobacterales bacterium HKCCD4356]NNV14051.1 D-2-hydroxyacid dehydrogenase family protein [Roseobacter sp. HKCCD7357]NNV18275.1 D-2-hydroxyacid dehydrogenase family protein [Roseobacter sp. HKCCD8768]NNV27750.1 D-2-hydroxyacid dehydrogenase family protein [Roseobacter sp. HKCCD8192]NNV32025.1 D-2-hydroxyacid dehydrogenase family protein [Roseobact